MSDCPLEPIYTTLNSVQIRLAGKVSFQQPGVEIVNPRQMPDALCRQLICDAETAVEQDLRGRYAVPFRSKKVGTFVGLPDHSKRAVRTIVDAMACVLILKDSFGAGTHITGEGYLKNYEDTYNDLLKRLLGQDVVTETAGERLYRRTGPLDDLLLASTNVADDGLFGQPGDSSPRRRGERGSNYAANQINDPSQGLFWFNGRYGPR